MSVQAFPFFSGALYRRMTCNVYLPPSYDLSQKSYPVIYLLHGMYGGESDWTRKGDMETTMNQRIEQGLLRECIVVMPNDGQYGQGTFFVDWFDGTGNFEQYIIYDLIPAIDAAFRTLSDRENRVVAGLSMGGFGAFSLSLRYPELFSAAGSLSGALASPQYLPQIEFDRSEYARMIGPAKGPYAKERDLFGLLQRRKAENQAPALYMNCGGNDYLLPINEAFASYASQIGYPVVYEKFEGDHNWDYWKERIHEVLQFFETYWEEETL